MWMFWVNEKGDYGWSEFADELIPYYENDARIGKELVLHRHASSTIRYTMVIADWFDMAVAEAEDVLGHGFTGRQRYERY